MILFIIFPALIRQDAKLPNVGIFVVFLGNFIELLLPDLTLQPKSKCLDIALLPDKRLPPSAISTHGQQGVRQHAVGSVGLEARCSFFLQAKFTCQKARTFSDCLQKMFESSA